MRPRLRAGPGPPGPRLTATATRPAPGTASRLGLAALLVGAGVLHFVIPSSYQRIVPRVVGHAAGMVAISGVVEIGAGVLLALPRTRRLGAWMALALFVVVWPANIQMALDGGIAGAGFPADSALLSWLRVPLQLPLFVWAYRQTRPAAGQPVTARRRGSSGGSGPSRRP